MIRRPGQRAEQLVRWLRANAQQYSIAIEHHPAAIMVVDKGEHGADLPAFIRERLDACSREIGFDWRDYLAIEPTLAGEAREG